MSLRELIARRPRGPGTGMVQALLEARRAGPTRSELEERFLEFVDDAGLPRSQTNRRLPIDGRLIEADCLWADRRLVVELDGRATHHTAAAFERDRARDRALQTAGWRVVRVTWRQLRDDPAALARDLRDLLR